MSTPRFKAGDKVLAFEPTFSGVSHAVFRPGSVLTIISVEEYPFGSGNSRVRNAVVATLGLPGSAHHWVDMDGIELMISDEEVTEAIRSITGATNG